MILEWSEQSKSWVETTDVTTSISVWLDWGIWGGMGKNVNELYLSSMPSYTKPNNANWVSMTVRSNHAFIRWSKDS